MNKWKKCKLGDVAEIVGGGTPKTKVPEYWNGNIPWLTPRDLSNFSGRYISNGERNISKVGLKNSSAKILPKGTVLLSSRAPVGYLVIALNEISTNQGFRSLIPNSKTNRLFLFYLLKNNVDYLKSQSTGTTFGELAGSTLKSLSFLFPPLPEQRAIALVLSNLDDKIDLLHRQNKTLEAMAETLFRQWFVEDFDRMEFEQLKLLVSVIDNRGKTPPYQNISTEYPVIEVNALVGDTRIVNYSVIRKYVLEETFKTWFRGHPKKFDILLSTVGSIGEISMFLIEKGSIAQNVVALSPSVISPFYLYQFLKFSQKQIMQLDIGGVQPSIKIPHLLSMLIPIPTKEKQKIFDGQLIKITSKIELNYKQIRTLEKLRDTLLPKLMSGEVRVDYNGNP
jgi:type I restriction enzyme S subunit